MSNTICGHERSVLKTVLLHPELCQGWSTEIESVNAHQRAWLALQDPAKLAEMLAERGRELGMRCAVLANHEAFDDCGADLAIKATANHIVIDLVPTMHTKYDVIAWLHDGPRIVELPQARALLAAWLGLEDGDREGAEKALRGES